MIELTGISVEEFAHPEEKSALETIKKIKYLERLLNWAADGETQVVLKTDILGNCFRITKTDMPGLYKSVQEVCRILDYGPIPQLYMCRSEKFDIRIFAGQTPLLVFPDFVIREFDEGMLRFQIGRAVTALKARTNQLKMAATAVLTITGFIPVAGEAMVPVLANWSRKAGLTEDRGGLLACQDMDAALRALMRVAGLPKKYIDTACLPEYMKTYTPFGKLSGMSRYLQTAVRMEAWNNDRIMELYKWYFSGMYDDILEEFE